MKKEENLGKFDYIIGTSLTNLTKEEPIVAVSVLFRKETLQYLRNLKYEHNKTLYKIENYKKFSAEVINDFANKISDLYFSVGYGIINLDEIKFIKNIYKCAIIAIQRSFHDLLRFMEYKPDIIIVDAPKQCKKNIKFPYFKADIIISNDNYISTICAKILAKKFKHAIMFNFRKN